MRTIELHLDEDDLRQRRNATMPGAFDAALARLTTWGLGAYDSVRILRDGSDTDLIAVYTGSGGTSRFVLGAVYSKDTGTYSFHS
jgi:hypothetical protein